MASKKRSADESHATTSKKRRQKEDQVLQLVQSQNHNLDWVRSGKVMRMHLRNFMCHENLLIEFNPRVNMVMGRNGSGKSAILTALVVGLGAKASKTSRSTNMKNLIKSGENNATIEIEIANIGEDSYDNDKYGDRIIIKRKIAISGSSQYELKDANGHVVSKSREDLMKILMFHNIQTDNPVFVLNQDAARSFLKDLDPLKNYELFLKATQLELILDKLNRCVQYYNDLKTKLVIRRKQLDLSEKDLEKLRAKYEKLKSAEEIKDKIRLCQLQRLWLKVTEQENKIRRMEDDIIEKERQRDSIIAKIDGSDSNSALQVILDQLQTEVQEKTVLLQEENRKLTMKRNAHKEANANYQAEHQQYRRDDARIKHTTEQINTLEIEIAQRTESCSSQNARKRKEIEDEKAILDKKRTEVEAMINTAKQELRNYEHNREKKIEERDNMEIERRNYDVKIQSVEHELSKIASSSNDSIEVYGKHVRSLLTMIDRAYQEGNFSARPKGPIGMYLEVPDKKWRGVVESQIQSLNGFIVNNNADRLALTKIIQQHFPRANHPIVTAGFLGKVYDVRKGAVPKTQGAHLLMDLIKCSDADIMNCLIDQFAVETVLLVDNKQLAEELTMNEESVPRNLQKVIVLDPHVEYHPAPSLKVYSLVLREPRFIQANMEDRKRVLNHEIKQYKEMQQNIQKQLLSIRQTLSSCDDDQKQQQVILRKHEKTLNEIKFRLNDLDNYEKPNENEDAALREELKKCQENLTKSKNSLKTREKVWMQLKQAAIDTNKDLQKQEEKINSIEADVNAMNEELNSRKLEAAKIGNSLMSLKSKADQLSETVAKMKCELDGEKEKYMDYQEEASSSGERIDTDMSAQELNNLIKSLQVRVSEICSTDENIDELKALVDDSDLKLRADRKGVNSLIELLDLLKKSRQQRFRFLKCLHEHMAIRVSHTFKQILKIRNFDGELEIDPAKRTLSMTVIPRDKEIENAVSSTKALSGGERSYATVALLISLWSCIDHPFYFLDEYDVFTDEFNRKVITKLLLNEAEKKAHRQYTFLSPQDMSFVEPSDTIRLHKLNDPRSGQS